LIGRCLRERTPLLVNDVYADPHYNATPETSDVPAELVVPLIVDGEILGRAQHRGAAGRRLRR
jgi:putative methionine-R-sulfoxide reductase with GAF domain